MLDIKQSSPSGLFCNAAEDGSKPVEMQRTENKRKKGDFMTKDQKINMYYELITRDTMRMLNKKERDNIELLDCYVMQKSRFMDACELVAEGRTPAQNEKISIMYNHCDNLRDLIISHLD